MAKVTMAEIVDAIKTVQYYRFPGTQVTICCLKLNNNFTAIGSSACVDPAEFDEELGKSIAYKRAEDEAWKLLGFRLADKLHTQSEG